MRQYSHALIAGIAMIGGIGAHEGRAQDAQAFYENLDQLAMIVRASPGGGYDAYGRMIAKYMGRHLPGDPDVVVRNMPGAGGIRAANYLANVADADGSIIGIMGNSFALSPLLEGESSGADYDPRQVAWVGSINREVGVGLLSADAPVESLEGMQDTTVFFGSSGAESTAAALGRMLNSLIGTQIEFIHGYAGQTEYFLAMERGETDGMIIPSFSGPNSVQARDAEAAGTASYFVQFTTSPAEIFGDAPTIFDLVENEADQQVVRLLLSQLELGRPVIAPPDTPQDRLDMLRAAFEAAVNDPDLLAEAEQLQLGVDPVLGAQAEELMAEVFNTPDDIVERARQIVAASE